MEWKPSSCASIDGRTPSLVPHKPGTTAAQTSTDAADCEREGQSIAETAPHPRMAATRPLQGILQLPNVTSLELT